MWTYLPFSPRCPVCCTLLCVICFPLGRWFCSSPRNVSTGRRYNDFVIVSIDLSCDLDTAMAIALWKCYITAKMVAFPCLFIWFVRLKASPTTPSPSTTRSSSPRSTNSFCDPNSASPRGYSPLARPPPSICRIPVYRFHVSTFEWGVADDSEAPKPRRRSVCAESPRFGRSPRGFGRIGVGRNRGVWRDKKSRRVPAVLYRIFAIRFFCRFGIPKNTAKLRGKRDTIIRVRFRGRYFLRVRPERGKRRWRG